MNEYDDYAIHQGCSLRRSRSTGRSRRQCGSIASTLANMQISHADMQISHARPPGSSNSPTVDNSRSGDTPRPPGWRFAIGQHQPPRPIIDCMDLGMVKVAPKLTNHCHTLYLFLMSKLHKKIFYFQEMQSYLCIITLSTPVIFSKDFFNARSIT